MSWFNRVRDVLAPGTDTRFEGSVVSPATGELLELASCSDQMFASGAMGEGFVVIPKDGAIVSPVTGTVTMVYETGHAFGIRTADGVEVLIHVGIDTVELGGGPFASRVGQGDPIKAGDPLVEVDLYSVRAAGKSTETMVLFPETGSRSFALEESGPVSRGQVVASVR